MIIPLTNVRVFQPDPFYADLVDFGKSTPSPNLYATDRGTRRVFKATTGSPPVTIGAMLLVGNSRINKSIRIERIDVRSEYRRNHIGYALLKALQLIEPFGHVTTSVHFQNHLAQEFFDNLGFTVEAIVQNSNAYRYDINLVGLTHKVIDSNWKLR